MKTSGLSISIAWTRGLAQALLLVALILAGCGPSGSPQSLGVPSTAGFLPGQVGSVSPTSGGVSFYAAARFLDQASMGPTPASVARVQSIGMAAWIDEQLRLPVSRINTPDDLIWYDINLDRATANRATEFTRAALHGAGLGNADQLRTRVAWVLSNFLVTSTRKVLPYCSAEFWNTLTAGALTPYGDLLKAVSRSPAMGVFLDNNQNRKDSLNENYGRELMQLFSVGLVMLNLDGTPRRDASGRAIETYSQADVIAATRALTGWSTVSDPRNKFVNNANGANCGVPMAPNWPGSHDSDAKTVLGKTIPAAGDAAADLAALVKILVEHPNAAPFVSLRLIQGMTTSNPSPAYLKRVATVFQQTGGDLAQVVKSVLMDPEARAGDLPSQTDNAFGRIREPFLQHVFVMRGLGCQIPLKWRGSNSTMDTVQMPMDAPSVFNWYPPNHLAPGSNLLAPEQKMLNSTEFSSRLGRYDYVLDDEGAIRSAGCDVDTFKSAAQTSDDSLIELINQRYFRGAMTPPTRQLFKEFSASASWLRNSPMRYTGAMLALATVTPGFGAAK